MKEALNGRKLITTIIWMHTKMATALFTKSFDDLFDQCIDIARKFNQIRRNSEKGKLYWKGWEGGIETKLNEVSNSLDFILEEQNKHGKAST